MEEHLQSFNKLLDEMTQKANIKDVCLLLD